MARLTGGPMHVHAATSDATTVLHDFRRDLDGGRRAAPAASLVSAVLHGHSHPQRHQHFSAGGNTMVTSDGALERADANDDAGGAASAAFAALMPLPAATLAWQPASAGHGVPRSSPWAASSRVAALPERPPRLPQV